VQIGKNPQTSFYNMNSSKGITPVVAVTLMLLVTVAAAGTLFATVQETQRNAQENAPELNLNIDNLYVESCWTEGSGPYQTSLAIRNEAEGSINNSEIDVIVEGQEKDYDLDPTGLVEPQETFELTFTGLSTEDEVGGGSDIMFFYGGNSMTYSCWD